jgi:hypothetical protein
MLEYGHGKVCDAGALAPDPRFYALRSHDAARRHFGLAAALLGTATPSSGSHVRCIVRQRAVVLWTARLGRAPRAREGMQMSATDVTAPTTLIRGRVQGIGSAIAQTAVHAGAPALRCMLIFLIAQAAFEEALAGTRRSVSLPATAPIPMARPPGQDRASAGQVSDRKLVRQRQVSPTLIGTRPQPIPATRQNVRIVGWAFLPDPSEKIELLGEAKARALDAEEAKKNAVAKSGEAKATVAALSLGRSKRH